MAKTYQERKEKAREEAKTWQFAISERNDSYGEFLEAQSKFEKLAKRYGLTKEFKENCII